MIDGDSIRVMHKGERDQFDCSGSIALKSQMAFEQEVTIYGDRHDGYGRRLAEVVLSNGRSLHQKLVKAGLALWFRNYPKDLWLGELERQALIANKGLWVEASAAVGMKKGWSLSREQSVRASLSNDIRTQLAKDNAIGGMASRVLNIREVRLA